MQPLRTAAALKAALHLLTPSLALSSPQVRFLLTRSACVALLVAIHEPLARPIPSASQSRVTSYPTAPSTATSARQMAVGLTQPTAKEQRPKDLEMTDK